MDVKASPCPVPFSPWAREDKKWWYCDDPVATTRFRLHVRMVILRISFYHINSFLIDNGYKAICLYCVERIVIRYLARKRIDDLLVLSCVCLADS